MDGVKKSKVGYWILGVVLAVGTTIGIVSFVNYAKRKKQEKDAAENQNFLLSIIKTLKEKGIVFGKDDSVLIKVLGKLTDEELNTIIVLLKKGKLEAADKTIIFAMIFKLLTPEKTTQEAAAFEVDGQNKKQANLKSADGSGKVKTYKIKNNKIIPCQRVLHDNETISIKRTKIIDGKTFINPFLEIWVNEADVQFVK